MTTINPATDIPANVNTLEKLIVWANMAFQNLNLTQTVVEGDLPPDAVINRLITAGIYHNAANTADIHQRFTARVTLRMIVNWDINSNGKDWQQVQEVNTAALPTFFRS